VGLSGAREDAAVFGGGLPRGGEAELRSTVLKLCGEHQRPRAGVGARRRHPGAIILKGAGFFLTATDRRGSKFEFPDKQAAISPTTKVTKITAHNPGFF
jgi:hypothetical protein